MMPPFPEWLARRAGIAKCRRWRYAPRGQVRALIEDAKKEPIRKNKPASKITRCEEREPL
jgi:hypothetical protein